MIKTDKLCPDLQYVLQRVREKAADYSAYQFSHQQNDILKTFFDLALEFESMPDFYRICVVIPSVYLDLLVRLYLHDINTAKLELVCDSRNGVYAEPQPAPNYLPLSENAYDYGQSYLVPISRKLYSSDEDRTLAGHPHLLGMLEISPRQGLNDADYFFFGKFSNRIAYNLHSRRLGQQNIRHLEFINNLVMDIEHNVIIPNMYFRHLFKQLRKSLNSFEELVDGLAATEAAASFGPTIMARLCALKEELAENHRHLLDHHANTSLFLESLFRRDHFREGHLVLKTRLCSVASEIIAPQLENYLGRFDLNGIEVEHPVGMDEEIYLTVDIGLLAQVYANLFSNGVKYAAEIVRKNGTRRKAMAYGREFISDYFGPNKSGIKFNVFTTGPHLRGDELTRIFEDGFRGANSAQNSGTGHGLSFIKQVVEIHGGRVGCELVEEGNNFFFVLPLPPPVATIESVTLDRRQGVR
jgi:signal transduction histidine kinase